ncbi:MAG: type II toxin-antitoxin system VapC family toxin [Candidatus Brocadiaceae bacterium]|nr:type II toxin-antitoxin system VapC family toxin [Candidatus Brocadiaceae bacterium]
MLKVYIETSVISYYTSKISRDIVIAGHQVSTKDFWNKLNSNELIPVISALVIKEASQGDIEVARKRRDAIQGFLVLDISKEAEELANLLIEKHGIPSESPEDALHIAIASVEKIDFITTWNFKHINNPFTKNKIKEIIENAGYICPVLASPDELLGEE